MRNKMQDVLSNALKVIISFFVALFLNKILSLFRKRQLYLSCWNSLDNTSVSNNAITINASVYNNGKEKEKNIIIQMPNGMACSVLSGNCDYQNDNGKIQIDRVLSGKKVSLIILIEGTRTLDKTSKPKIKSEDADGKTYLTTDIVPPSAGYLTLSAAFLITLIGGLSYLIASGANPDEMFARSHNSLFYNNYYNNGFSFNPIGSSTLTETYNIQEKEFPIELMDARRLNGQIQYKFRIVNKYNYPMLVSAEYDINNSHDFWREMSKINDAVDDNLAVKKKLELYEKYHVDTNIEPYLDYPTLARRSDVTVKENSLGFLIITRKDNRELSLEDMNLTITLKVTTNGNEYESIELKFYSYKNAKTKAMFH